MFTIQNRAILARVVSKTPVSRAIACPRRRHTRAIRYDSGTHSSHGARPKNRPTAWRRQTPQTKNVGQNIPTPSNTPREQPISEVGGGTPTMFGMEPQIDTIVLDFPISLALWNDVAESIDFGPANRRKMGFSPLKIFRWHV